MYQGPPAYVHPAEVRPRTGSRDRTFGDGQAVTVPLKPGVAVYVPEPYSGDPRCRIVSVTGENVVMTRPGYDFTVSTGGASWRLSRLAHVPRAGSTA